MLEVNNISKVFKDRKVVDGISFKVEPGEIVGLLGENGAGKTTTLRMISTMLKVTEGSVKVNGFDVGTEGNKVRGEIGILFGGDIGLYDRLTGSENIMYFGRLFGLSEEECKKNIQELSKEFQMEEYIDKPVGKFSRGMKQKVSIGRAIVHKPSVILLDEPSTGLDVRATKVIHEFIKRCKVENKTILFSSHSMTEVEKLCDRIVIINEGKLVDQGTISYLKEKYNKDNLEDVFISLIGGEGYE